MHPQRTALNAPSASPNSAHPRPKAILIHGFVFSILPPVIQRPKSTTAPSPATNLRTQASRTRIRTYLIHSLSHKDIHSNEAITKHHPANIGRMIEPTKLTKSTSKIHPKASFQHPFAPSQATLNSMGSFYTPPTPAPTLSSHLILKGRHISLA